jgi:hypothetical protein
MTCYLLNVVLLMNSLAFLQWWIEMQAASIHWALDVSPAHTYRNNLSRSYCNHLIYPETKPAAFGKAKKGIRRQPVQSGLTLGF